MCWLCDDHQRLAFSGYIVLVDVILLVLLNATLFSINLFIVRLLDCLQDSLDFVVLLILMCIVILISR